MPQPGYLTAVITAVLGTAVGGLLMWQVYRTRRKKLPSVQKAAEPVDDPCPVENGLTHFTEKEVETATCQTQQLVPVEQIPSSEQLLGVKPVVVSSEDEWQQLWPLMQKELSVFPVLGLDCEWVKTEGVRNTFSMF